MVRVLLLRLEVVLCRMGIKMEREVDVRVSRENLFTKKAVVSYVQIFLMITAVFSFSWIFYEYGDYIEGVMGGVDSLRLESLGYIESEVDEEKWWDNLAFGIGSVSAAPGDVCCEQTINGNTCQNVNSELCDQSYRVAPSNCEVTTFCEVGCCISDNTGLCNLATSRIDCENINGTFKQGAECNVQECKLGCCVLGNQAKWTTEANCEYEGNTENNDILTEWRFDQDSDTEVECLFNVERDKEGACVFDSDNEKKCVYTTLEECVSRTGSESNFDHEGRFCSDPELETSCEARDHKGCVDGDEEVYWFDSCDNKEDVAEDCDLFRGSYCGEDDGEFSCKDVDCEVDGEVRKNGESWCTYDGKIGDGKDPAGSRHVKHICYLGTERLAPCADFRNEICVQEDALTAEGDSFSQAACRMNQWRNCLGYNQEEDAEAIRAKCDKNVDCHMIDIDMAGSFSFSVCLPQYPPGFDLNSELDVLNDDGEITPEYYQVSSADGICSTATQRCTETWQCGIFGCICIDNCLCHTSTFTNDMNEFCVSLGDCGAYINYIGEWTDDGYGVKGAPRLGPGALGGSANAGPQAGQKPAEPGNVEFFETLNPGLLPDIQRDEYGNNLSAFELELMEASGSYGSPLLLKILTNKNDSSVWGALGDLAAGPIGLSRFTGAISSVQAAIDAQTDHRDPEQPPDLSMLIAMIAALIAYVITQSIMAAMMAAMLGFLLGISWIMFIDIDFSCGPWQPPAGGGDCNECNSLEIPCTEYRCESLGSLCYLSNKGTGNELCLSKPQNETLPVISPLMSAISEGYRYEDVNRNGFRIVNATDEGCLEPYTSVDFGIKVDPFARCRWSNDSKDSYGDMYELFGLKGNYILPAHVTKLFFPNPEAFKNKYNLTDREIEELGKWDFYVKCKTASGKINPEPYRINTCIRPGPDLTPPRVTLTQPLDNTYLEHGEDEQEVTIYVNEPSQCKYSLLDKDFDEMTNELDCETSPSIFTQFGWKCQTTLTGLLNNTKFYVKCQDTSENKNTMTESFVYEFIISKSELFIHEVLPKIGEKMISGVEPVTAKFRLSTSGGARTGEAICRWEGNGFGDGFRYEEANGSNRHSYEVNLVQGKYNINFMCEDIAGNKAENSTSFEVRIDKFGPTITRIYYDFGLKVSTAEDAECRFDFKRNFIFENATKMSGSGKEHSTGWRLKTYYVQCSDQYGNKGGKIRVKPVS